MPPTAREKPPLEMASVLFTDIVGFSRNALETQEQMLQDLQTIVRDTLDYKRAEAEGHLLKLPTGDGMALVFFQDPLAPVRCAVDIQKALKDHPTIQLRTGVHTGPIFRHSDIKDNINVVGGGINLAQRVMDCGDAGHVLVSHSVAEVLEQLSGWGQCMKDLGIYEVKHGVKVHLYNVVRDGGGNPAIPSRLKDLPREGRNHGQAKTGESRALWPIWVALAVVALGAGAWWKFFSGGGSTDPSKQVKVVVPQQVPERMLQYHIIVQKFQKREQKSQKPKAIGDPIRLGKEKRFDVDDGLTLVMSAAEPGYLYVINEGPESTPAKPDLNGFFPDSRKRGGSAHLEFGQEESISMQSDGQKGKEKMWLVWSVEPIPEMDVIRNWVNREDRGVIKDPQQALAMYRLLQKYSGAEAKGNAEATFDEYHSLTLLHGRVPVLVRKIELEHG